MTVPWIVENRTVRPRQTGVASYTVLIWLTAERIAEGNRFQKHVESRRTFRNVPLPTHRRPTTPGEMLRHEFMEPMKLTQHALADALGIDRPALNAILNDRRSLTAKMALRLERVLGLSASFWIDLQHTVDLWDAIHDPETQREIRGLKCLTSRSSA